MNFEATWEQDQPLLLFSYYGPCGNEDSAVRALEGDPNGWTSFASNMISSIPGAGSLRYESHIALGAAGERYTLFAAPTHMILATVDQTGPIWWPEIGDELDTSGVLSKFSRQRVFTDSSGAPVVAFRFGRAVKIYRPN